MFCVNEWVKVFLELKWIVPKSFVRPPVLFSREYLTLRKILLKFYAVCESFEVKNSYT